MNFSKELPGRLLNAKRIFKHGREHAERGDSLNLFNRTIPCLFKI